MCDYDMFWFPFDSQSCGIKLYQKEDNVHLVPDGLTYGGPQHLEQYTVTGLRMCHTNIQVRQTLTVWARYILEPPWTCGDLYLYLSRATLHLRRSLSLSLQGYLGLAMIFIWIFKEPYWTWNHFYLYLSRVTLDLNCSLSLSFQGHLGLEMIFSLSRPLTSSMLTTFLPTSILVLTINDAS